MFRKYWATFRRLRVLHILHNILHYGKLRQNKRLYRQFGIHKSTVASLSHRDITRPGKMIPWLDQPDAAQQLEASRPPVIFPVQWMEELKFWPERGFMILKGFASEKMCDAINSDLDKLVRNGTVDFDYTNSRVMNAYIHSDVISTETNDEQLKKFLSYTLGAEVVRFQTISFFKGSKQKTHSDFIHMATEPVGYLIATWLALEDISADSGPLHYYPGSHKLPYILGEDFDHSSNALTVGDDLYGNYEMKIAALVEEKGLEKQVFLAKKGDLLVWHANLLHGGEPVLNEKLTRKSLVTHYFCKGDILCYHEITQRPAVIAE